MKGSVKFGDSVEVEGSVKFRDSVEVEVSIKFGGLDYLVTALLILLNASIWVLLELGLKWISYLYSASFNLQKVNVDPGSLILNNQFKTPWSVTILNF